MACLSPSSGLLARHFHRVVSYSRGHNRQLSICPLPAPSAMSTSLVVGSTPDALAAELIKRIVSIAEQAVLARGVCNVSVSGGSMPKVRMIHTYLVVRKTTHTEADSSSSAVCCIFPLLQAKAVVYCYVLLLLLLYKYPSLLLSSLQLNPHSFQRSDFVPGTGRHRCEDPFMRMLSAPYCCCTTGCSINCRPSISAASLPPASVEQKTCGSSSRIRKQPKAI